MNAGLDASLTAVTALIGIAAPVLLYLAARREAHEHGQRAEQSTRDGERLSTMLGTITARRLTDAIAANARRSARTAMRERVLAAMSMASGTRLPPEMVGTDPLTDVLPRRPPGVDVSDIVSHLRFEPQLIESLELSVRTYNAVKRADIHDTWQLMTTAMERIERPVQEEVLASLRRWLYSEIDESEIGVTRVSPVELALPHIAVVVLQQTDGMFRAQVSRTGTTVLTSEPFPTPESAFAAVADVLRTEPIRGRLFDDGPSYHDDDTN